MHIPKQEEDLVEGNVGVVDLVAGESGEELRRDLEGGYVAGRGSLGEYYGEHCWCAFHVGSFFNCLENFNRID